MNILVLGAGAIGSLFGALFSKHNNVILIGRKPHVSVIQKSGLQIIGQPHDDATVLRAAAAFEKVSPWANNLPPMN